MGGSKPKRGPAGAAAADSGKGRGLSVGSVVVIGLSALVGGFCLPMLGQAETPLGQPLPALPAPIFEILPAEQPDKTSFREKRTIEAWLPKLLPEPDGLPPLVQGYDSAGLFSIRHPYGAQTVAFPLDDVMQDGILSQAGLQFDMGLSIIKYSMPGRQPGENLAAYTARVRGELAAKGATFYDDKDSAIELEYYRFSQLRYKRFSEEEGEEIAHFLFIGPLGPNNVLVADFMSRTADYERAKALAAKIAGSFEPKATTAGYAIAEFPELGAGLSTEEDRAGQQL